MTPLPKRKLSTRRQGKRRATKLALISVVVGCSNCKMPTKPHQICKFCGWYKGKEVKKVVVKPKKTK